MAAFLLPQLHTARGCIVKRLWGNPSFSLLVVSDKNIGDDERILGHLLKLEIRKPIFDEAQTFHLQYQLLNKFKKLMKNFIFVV